MPYPENYLDPVPVRHVFTGVVVFGTSWCFRVSRNFGISVIALVFWSIFLGISPWKSFPGRTENTIAVPILILLLYSLFPIMDKNIILLWFLIMFLRCFGGIMKATCYVTLIAVVLVDLVWSMLKVPLPMRKRLRKVRLKILLLTTAFGLGAFCEQRMYLFHYSMIIMRIWRSAGVIIL